MTNIYTVEDARAAMTDAEKDAARAKSAATVVIDGLVQEMAKLVEALEDMKTQRDRALQPDSFPRLYCPACEILTGRRRGCNVCGFSGYIDEPRYEKD